jgi:hypothetical protein
VSVKASSLAAWPIAAGMMGWMLYRARRISLVGLAIGGVSAVGVAVLLALVIFPQRGSYTAQGLLSNLFTNPFTVEGALPWYGLLASPSKSLFLYAPVMALGVLGWSRFYRRHRLMAVGVLGLFVSVLISLRGTAWWGGLAWGPRFLLPLMAVGLLPALEVLPRQGWAWLITAMSIGVQALSATINWTLTHARLINLAQTMESDLAPEIQIGLDWGRWADLPPFQLFQRWGREAFDLVWLYTGLAGEVRLDAALGLILAAGVAVTGLMVLAIWRNWPPHRAGAALGLSAAALVLAGPLLLTRAYRALPDYPGLTADEAHALAGRVWAPPAAPDRIVYVSSDIYTYILIPGWAC